MSEREYICLGDKKIGYIENGTFYTLRKPEHFMRKFGGFGISSKILKQLLERDIKNIVFVYEGKRENCIFRTTVAKILGIGIIEWDYSFGFEDKQYFIPLKDMEKGYQESRP